VKDCAQRKRGGKEKEKEKEEKKRKTNGEKKVVLR